ncbi:MAG: DUF4153 domain-containing protein [Elusimicrobia bacterium]|nr:DUF4153 domain-containing protein [Elusimicrobiota bacterium]
MGRTLSRFPFAAAAAVSACAVAWTMVGMPEPPPVVWIKLLLSLTLGIALLSGLTLMSERPGMPEAFKSYVMPGGLLFLLFFFYFFAVNSALDYRTRYAQWLFIVFLFLTFAPYLAAGEVNGFWQFNKRIVLRIFISCFYSGVLFAGTSLALAAVDKLLGVEIDEKVYQYLWLFAAYVFGPLHLLAGIPREYAELEEDRTYPKGLKLFTQYVLIPLASVYYLILYAYMAKILYTQQWPQGWVSWLTTSASLLGLVTFLLLYPVRELEENRWIKSYSRGFCAAAVPLLFMLFAAVFKRTGQYGLTEHRYFLIVLAAWLFGIFLYFIFSRKPDIKLVPVTLALLAVSVSLGPWGAYSVSLSSQLGRLESTLLKNGLLVNGKAVKLERELPPEERKELSAGLDYVASFHGLGPLKKYFDRNLDTLAEKKGGYRRGTGAARELMKEMGQTYLSHWETGASKYASFSVERTELGIRGFDLAVRFTTRYNALREGAAADKYSVVLNGKTQSLKLFKGRLFRIEVPLKPVRDGLSGKYKEIHSDAVPQELLSASAENGSAKVKVYFYVLAGNRKDDGEMEFTHGEGLLLVKEKRLP